MTLRAHPGGLIWDGVGGGYVTPEEWERIKAERRPESDRLQKERMKPGGEYDQMRQRMVERANSPDNPHRPEGKVLQPYVRGQDPVWKVGKQTQKPGGGGKSKSTKPPRPSKSNPLTPEMREEAREGGWVYGHGRGAGGWERIKGHPRFDESFGQPMGSQTLPEPQGGGIGQQQGVASMQDQINAAGAGGFEQQYDPTRQYPGPGGQWGGGGGYGGSVGHQQAAAAAYQQQQFAGPNSAAKQQAAQAAWQPQGGGQDAGQGIYGGRTVNMLTGLDPQGFNVAGPGASSTAWYQTYGGGTGNAGDMRTWNPQERSQYESSVRDATKMPPGGRGGTRRMKPAGGRPPVNPSGPGRKTQ